MNCKISLKIHRLLQMTEQGRHIRDHCGIANKAIDLHSRLYCPPQNHKWGSENAPLYPSEIRSSQTQKASDQMHPRDFRLRIDAYMAATTSHWPFAYMYVVSRCG
ncbi:PREDICTED: uncharacterized protein LOC108358057 [Rhagoletis zephyria]|uniref:uncharacterized protein LOC108358057 n=1 Tax=Rhagoletis zephyria TaxID=28612 RepID=UPI000811A555|nr:PREDICTED: uncharacterized protein LOC108358057 [Rhagoletis zephyria]